MVRMEEPGKNSVSSVVQMITFNDGALKRMTVEIVEIIQEIIEIIGVQSNQGRSHSLRNIDVL